MKILFFTDDFSSVNVHYASEHGLKMRDVREYYDGDTLENCDAVCGDVPDAYLKRYPLYDIATQTVQPKASSNALTEADVKLLISEALKNLPTGTNAGVGTTIKPSTSLQASGSSSTLIQQGGLITYVGEVDVETSILELDPDNDWTTRQTPSFDTAYTFEGKVYIPFDVPLSKILFWQTIIHDNTGTSSISTLKPSGTGIDVLAGYAGDIEFVHNDTGEIVGYKPKIKTVRVMYQVVGVA